MKTVPIQFVHAGGVTHETPFPRATFSALEATVTLEDQTREKRIAFIIAKSSHEYGSVFLTIKETQEVIEHLKKLIT